MKTSCPNPTCGMGLDIPIFSREEGEGKRGRNIICPKCDAFFWLSPSGEPMFFPLATDQVGRPRLRMA
ncbi:MAG: hypothetical protein Q8O93_02870 [bacterium]|nr:hypothetical protein [bacterium]